MTGGYSGCLTDVGGLMLARAHDFSGGDYLEGYYMFSPLERAP